MANNRRKKKKSAEKATRKATETTNQKSGFWQELPQWKKHIVSAVALLFLSLLFFAPVHFSGKQLIGGDTVSWRSMADSMIEYRDAEGEEPLWATNPFGGMPGYLISYQKSVPQLDTVFAMLRKIIWPTSHFFVLLFGTYLCGFLLTKNSLVSIFGSVAFGFTTYIPVFLAAGHNTKFVALAFAPLFFAAFLYTVRKPGPIASLVFGITLAALLRADHVQIAYYFAVVGGIWWIVEGISSAREGQLRSFGMKTAWLGLGSVIGLLMVAEPYLSIWDYKEFSIRGSGALSAAAGDGLAWEYAMGWSQGRLEMLTLLIADAFGGSAAYWGPKVFTGGPHYLGGAVIALLSVGLYRVRSKATLALGIALLATLVFALGENFAIVNKPMFNFFPLFSSFRVPETWLVVTAFVAALLAMIGLNSIVSVTESSAVTAASAAKQLPKSLYPIAGIAAILLILLVANSSILSFEKSGERDRIMVQVASQNQVSMDDPRVASTADEFLYQTKLTRKESFRNDALRSLVVVLIIGLLIFLLARKKISATALVLASVLLLTIDLTTVARRYLSDRNLTESTDAASVVPELGFDRFILDKIQEAGGPGHFRVYSREGDVTTTARPAYFYETVNGYHAAKLQIYQDYLDEVLVGDRGLPQPVGLDLMSVKYIVSSSPLPGLRTVFSDEDTGWSVLEKPNAMARAHFVGEVVVQEDQGLVLDRLREGSIDLRHQALVSTRIDLEPAPINASSTVNVALEHFDARRIEYAVETDADRLLAVAEVYYPAGWKAFVDDVETPIIRTNYLQRGVVVPSGSHLVRFEFNPRSHSLGVIISGITTAVVFLLLILLVYRERQQNGDLEVGVLDATADSTADRVN